MSYIPCRLAMVIFVDNCGGREYIFCPEVNFEIASLFQRKKKDGICGWRSSH